jgi:hypothetical protein
MDRQIIWTAWFQGRQRAPNHVQRIFRLWEELNPDRQLHVIEDAEAQEILERVGVRQPRMTPQAKADLVRLIMLKEHGGVWVDSTLLPMVPLSAWSDDLTKQAGFFAFRSAGLPDLVLQTWFLSAAKANPLVSKWCDFFVDYFKAPRCWSNWKRAVYHLKFSDYIDYCRAERKRDMLWFVDPDRGRHCFFHPYMATNYNLAYLLKNDIELQEIWGDVPARWETLPGLVGAVARDAETPLNSFHDIVREVLPHSPVHKLNHRDKRFDEVVSQARDLMNLAKD